MVLMHYFLVHQHSWYSLPVTVSVCVLSVLGCGLILMYLYSLEHWVVGNRRVPPLDVSKTAKSKSAVVLINYKDSSEQAGVPDQINPVETIQGNENIMFVSYV